MSYQKRERIIDKDGVIIFGRVIDNRGRLGNYEVYSDLYGAEPHVYAQYAEAEKRANGIWFAMAKNQQQKEPPKQQKKKR